MAAPRPNPVRMCLTSVFFLLGCTDPAAPTPAPTPAEPAPPLAPAPAPTDSQTGANPLPYAVTAPADMRALSDAAEADYDEDGRLDRAKITWEGGSGSATATLTLALGDGRTLTATQGGSFGVRTSLARLDVPWRTPNLLHAAGWLLFGSVTFVRLHPYGQLPGGGEGPRESPENRGRIPVADEEHPAQPGASRGYPGSAEGFPWASGENQGLEPHPAMAWVHDTLALPPLPRSGGQLQARAWAPRWDQGPPTPSPPALSMVVLPSVLRSTGGEPVPDTAMLQITNWGLDKLVPGQRCGSRQVYLAAHGVAVHEPATDRSAWLWVSGLPGVSAAQKLRWRSVTSAVCLDGDLVELRLSLEEPRRVIVSPGYARWVEVPVDEPLDLPAVRAALTPRVEDLDGDGKPDPITWRFTDGAHCCYVPTVHLSRSGPVELPVELDGGVSRAGPGGGSCGVGFDEEPVQRCFVGEVGGRPALLLHESYTYHEWPPTESERAAGLLSAWRQFTFPESGGFEQADWGAVTPTE
jgi:hypothetical protein